MDAEQKQQIIDEATGVLQRNDRKHWTIPAERLYSHQWLWDSCFIAIGLSHLDIIRAKAEILNLIRGQWANGMLPHMIFAPGDQHRRDRELWRSYLSPFAPDKVFTSGVTQPPILAEAVVRIGKKMSAHERRTWYQTVYPALVRYHQWLYTERDPHNEGLIVTLHPYETGLDNTPPWIRSLREFGMPWWINLVEKLKLQSVINILRRDTRYVPPGQRMSTIEALAYIAALRRMRRRNWNTEAILNGSQFSIEDITFNSIAIRSNQHLAEIARSIRRELPETLLQSMKKAEEALDSLWEASTGQYYSRNFVTHKLIDEPSIGTLMPLYAGCITKERAKQLVEELLLNKNHFGLDWPIPSVPRSSLYFDPEKYWQGPSWINTNWLIVDGLRRYGYSEIADSIQTMSLRAVAKYGCYEYFNPLYGTPAGAKGFSWTAALCIDWLKSSSAE